MRLFSCLTVLVLGGVNAAADEIVPAHTLLTSLGDSGATVEFNVDVHIAPEGRVEERRWYFQNGKKLPLSAITNRDSYCFIGTYGDLYEPKTYKKGETYAHLDLVTEVGNQIYFANRGHEQLFFRSHREDLFVVGCEAPSLDSKAALTVGDVYRHLGYNVLLKSPRAGRDLKLIELAGQAKPLTLPYEAVRPMIRRLVFLRDYKFRSGRNSGWDGSRYFFQDGRPIKDNINLSGLDRRRAHCAFRFDEDLDWSVEYRAGGEFVPVRQYNLKSAIVLESDQYKVNGNYIRSVICKPADGRPVAPEDILSSFGIERVQIAN